MARCATGADACVDADVALAFVRGHATGAAREEVESRIDACARCRAVIAEAARDTSAEASTRVERHRAVARDDSVELAAGETVGRYLVERPLGEGGMGVVSLARDPELRRAVVIKLVRPDMAGPEGNVAFEARLTREAQAMAQLSHANVVQIFDIGRHRDRVFIAMEFIPGRTLDAWLIERPRSVDDILAIFRQAGAGLAAAHRAGLVHRDFKPTNVLVDESGTAKVTDFGLARAASRVPDTAVDHVTQPRVSGVHAVLTRADAVIGTPAYMAPEQLTGEAVDARVDQYSFAVTLLDALLGQSPSRRTTSPVDAPATIEAALVAAAVPPRVRAAIARALAIEPADRFATLDEMLRELAPVRRPRWPIAAAAALVVLGAGGALALRSQKACTAEALQRWNGSARARVIAALSTDTRPFSRWTAERIAGAIDSAVGELSQLEIDRCEGRSLPEHACLGPREHALDSALVELSVGKAANPWQLVQAIARCDEGANARARDVTAFIASNTNEAMGLADLAAGKDQSALRDFAAQGVAGEQLDDDGIRARTLLHELDLARWQGRASDAGRVADELHAMLARHPDSPREELAIASGEAAAFTELGVPERAWSAVGRAELLAEQLHDADAELRARVARGYATYLARLDPEAARTLVKTALASAPTAGDDARADAHALLSDLAIEVRDYPAALAEAKAVLDIAPRRASSSLDIIRVAKARALAGDLDGGFGQLGAMHYDDPPTVARVLLARGEVLLRVHRENDAIENLNRARYDLSQVSQDKHEQFLPALDRLALASSSCLAQAAVPHGMAYCECERELEGYPSDAPLRAVCLLTSGAAAIARHSEYEAQSDFKRALAIARDKHLAPLFVARAELAVALVPGSSLSARREHAVAARALYDSLNRANDVAAIDKWLLDNGGPYTPPPPPDPKDPWKH